MVGTNQSWSDQENDLTVSAYFAMLERELAGLDYVKSRSRRELMPLLEQRSESAVEFKFQNISAVLRTLGQPWIDGYKPAIQFQSSLVDAVLRWLEARPYWGSPGSRFAAPPPSGQAFSEPKALWIGPSPTSSNAPPPIDPATIEFIARKFDVAGRDARNRALGRAGEELVLHHERATLRACGKSSLAQQVRWIADEEGDGAGFDISSFDADGRHRLIEVKTTNGWDRTPFHISKRELDAADANRECWSLVRVWNFAREPRAFELRPPLNAHVALTPTSFAASLH